MALDPFVTKPPIIRTVKLGFSLSKIAFSNPFVKTVNCKSVSASTFASSYVVELASNKIH
ncbi:Uncharacterised protein [Staphylococcus aureus]|nr:Uncharacterised protein [Staphylococcus aureus]